MGDQLLKILKLDDCKLRFLENQTPELCMEAVKQNSSALYLVKEQTATLCMEAIKNDPSGWILQYVKNQTPELCMTAVKQNGKALQYVKNQTPEICMEAVKQSWEAFQYVKNQTPELCMTAVKQNGLVLEFVEDQTPEICMAAVQQEAFALEFVEDQTEELCIEAIKEEPFTFRFVKKQTEAICRAVMEEDKTFFIDIDHQFKYLFFDQIDPGKLIELSKDECLGCHWCNPDGIPDPPPSIPVPEGHVLSMHLSSNKNKNDEWMKVFSTYDSATKIILDFYHKYKDDESYDEPPINWVCKHYNPIELSKILSENMDYYKIDLFEEYSAKCHNYPVLFISLCKVR